ncbi:MAG: response regulator [Kofleriaceae bacterium]
MSKIVLHVDDSATMQMVADITFRGTEYKCVGARSVDDALEKVRAQRPALVLADAQMPGKSGYDLCLAMKSDPRLCEIPVVILCGNAQPFDPVRGGQVGADGSLPKPWDSNVMLEKVGEALERAAGGVSKPGSAPVTPPTPSSSASAAKAAPQPPRSATIMGMPTLKMPPAGNAPSVPVTSANPAAAIAPAVAPRAPAAAPALPGLATRPAAVAAVASPPMVVPAVVPAAAPARPPMVSGTPTKRSALVERTLAKMAARLAEATGLEAGSPELMALLKLSTEVVERIVWEVVPELAEQIIRENLDQLAAARRN